jgi:hypothetical protein
MAKMNLADEMDRLKTVYGGMEDSELLELSRDPEALTEIALQVLSGEMRRRSLEPPAAKPAAPLAAETESKQGTHSEPVMIRRFRDLPIAALAKAALESAGIESFLVDENLVRLDWFYSNLVGGVQLFVRAEDAAEATTILDEAVPMDTADDKLADTEQHQDSAQK